MGDMIDATVQPQCDRGCTVTAPPFAASQVAVLYCPLPNREAGGNMTLAIGIATPAGIVLAADGRVTRSELGGFGKERDNAEKLHGIGKYGIATAGFIGLTTNMLDRLRADRKLLADWDDVRDASLALEEFVQGYMAKFQRFPVDTWPRGSFLLAGYERDGRTPHLYSLHTQWWAEPGEFNWVGTARGGTAAETIGTLLLDDWGTQPTLDQAQVFAILAIEVAGMVDFSVGPPHRLATITPEDGYRDVSAELPGLLAQSRRTRDRVRAAFLATDA